MSKSQDNIFAIKFNKLLAEDMFAGAGGVFGDADSMGHGGAIEMTDFYATGDNRLPRGGKKKKKQTKSKSKQNKDVGVNMLTPVQRRPLHNSM